MDKILETQPSNVESQKIENLNSLHMGKEIESAIKNLPPQKTPGEKASLVKSIKYVKNQYQYFSNSSKKSEEEILPNLLRLALRISQEKYRSISLMDRDIRILNKISAHQIHEQIKKDYTP